jgi:hypothetical protein
MVIASSLSLTACTGWNVNGINMTGENSGDTPSYCQTNPEICIVAGVVIAGGAIAFTVSQKGHHEDVHYAEPSDARLKQDVRPVANINGVQLYAFRYLGDDRVFVGALAQDLLKNKTLGKAVSIGSDGYYRVDYAQLGLSVMNAEDMFLAGNTAAGLTLSRQL